MWNIRVNLYELSDKFISLKDLAGQEVNFLYFHGFTMHDGNFPLVKNMLEQGLLQADSCQMLKPELLADQQFMAQAAAGKFITLSFAFTESEYSLDYDQIQPLLAPLMSKAKNIGFAFSYGNLIAQRLNQEFFRKDFALDLELHAVRGTMLPYHDAYSIPQEQFENAQYGWNRDFLEKNFLFLMGMPRAEIVQFRQRLKEVPESVVDYQGDIMRRLYAQYPQYLEMFNNPALMKSWKSLHLAKQDRIYPESNLISLAKHLNLPFSIADKPHYIEPQEIIELLLNSTDHAAI